MIYCPVMPEKENLMEGMIIKVVDPDDDYLGIEIFASNERYSGATRIYAGLDELGEFAALIDGFPNSSYDERKYEFGSRDESFAGGYCSLRFHSTDMVGHTAVEIEIEEDTQHYTSAMAKMTFKTEAADIDNFVQQLREVEREQAGEATLLQKV